MVIVVQDSLLVKVSGYNILVMQVESKAMVILVQDSLLVKVGGCI